MPRNYNKKEKAYNETTIQCAILEIVNDKKSITATAKKHRMSKTFLLKRYHLYLENTSFEVPLSKRGKKKALPDHIETKFATCLKTMESMGLGPSQVEFLSIVHDYILQNNIPNNFRDNTPGYDWLTLFMKRQNFTFKKGGQMQIARKTVTSDPFVIYGYYGLLKSKMEELNILNRPECIWNLDETCFPQDPSRTLTIGTKGEQTVRVTQGAQRENISVLATCCANGKVLPPLIIFKAKKLLHSWIGNEAIEGTEYSISDKGWMTREVFDSFFVRFIEQTKDIRPILLILDGHVSHTSIEVIEKAAQEGISILKLPPHCTDLLQPLDKSCFSPLKSYYEDLLNEFRQATGGRVKLEKNQFVNMLCAAWPKGLKEENVKSGFASTGIFPFDQTKYATDRLDPVKLVTYNTWVNRGSQKLDNGDPDLGDLLDQLDVCSERVDTDQPHITTENEDSAEAAQNELANNADKSTADLAYASTSRVATSFETQNSHKMPSKEAPRTTERTLDVLVDELQALAPRGFKYRIELIRDEDSSYGIASVLNARGRSIAKNTDKRRLDMHAKVMTQSECLDAMRKRQTEDNEKQEKKQRRKEGKRKLLTKKTTKNKKRKVEDDDKESTTTVSSCHMTDYSSDFSFNLSSDNDDPEERSPSSNKKPLTDMNTLKKTNKLLKPDLANDDFLEEGGFYAVYYTDPELTYYWGKILRTFSDSPLGPNKTVEIDFLTKKTVTSDKKRWTWAEKSLTAKHDIDIVPLNFVFYGPVKGNSVKGVFTFNEEEVWGHLQDII